MVKRAKIKPNSYQDSVKLMNLSEKIRSIPGIEKAMAIMGTEGNKTTLKSAGLNGKEIEGAGPNDIILVVQGEAKPVEEAIEQFFVSLDEHIQEKDGAVFRPRSIDLAAREMPEATLTIISVPGDFAAFEAKKALMKGINVHIFSDNVPIEQEKELKLLARDLGLIVMGPDCGTSIIKGKPICFANEVSPGSIGIVAGSGTGIQEATTLIDHLGAGISHAIGTGGRDFSDEIGGITTLSAMDLLEKDPQTEVILIISKEPGKKVEQLVIEKAQGLSKPVVINFLGEKPTDYGKGVYQANNFEEAAAISVGLTKGEKVGPGMLIDDRNAKEKIVKEEVRKLNPEQKNVRGLFSGGSLATEAAVIIREKIKGIKINSLVQGIERLEDLYSGSGDFILDMGANEFTRGRPHPMIDPTYRSERLEKEWKDPEVGVILCDLVLGYGSHQDPASILAEAVEKARTENKRNVAVIASVCGTEADPQKKSAQEKILTEAGVIVLPTNVYAAEVAAEIAKANRERR